MPEPAYIHRLVTIVYLQYDVILFPLVSFAFVTIIFFSTYLIYISISLFIYIFDLIVVIITYCCYYYLLLQVFPVNFTKLFRISIS